VQDATTQKISEEGKLYEQQEEEVSGINIERARRVLRAEDAFDKIRERQKIKERKKEEKRKAKEAKKRKNGVEV
jgi:ATP-dependent RNA helicase DDX10/DBP4